MFTVFAVAFDKDTFNAVEFHLFRIDAINDAIVEAHAGIALLINAKGPFIPARIALDTNVLDIGKW